MTPEQIDALPEYTNAQQLKLVRYTIMQVLQTGHAIGKGDRNWTSHDLPELRKMEQELVCTIADEDEDNDGGIALAVFGQPR